MSRALPLLVFLFAAMLGMATPCRAQPEAGGSPAFEAMLRQADSVRSSDPVQFERLLGQLNASTDIASAAQREQLAYLKAYHLAYTGRFDLAAESLKTLFENAADPTLKFRAGSLLVNSYAATREFADGLRILERTLAMVDQVKDREVRHHGWHSAAVIYNEVGQYELGRHYADLVLADGASARTACVTGYARLEAVYKLQQIDHQDESVQRLLAQCEQAGEPLAGLFLKTYQAKFLAAQGDRMKAIGTLEQILAQTEGTHYARLIGEVHSLLAQWKFAEGLANEAERHAQVAIERSVGIVHSLPQVDAYRTLYEIAMQRKDTAKALEYLRAYTDADRAYLDGAKARELAFQMVKHETLQKNQTIELLNKQNQVLQLEQQVHAKSTQATRLLIALLAVLLATIAYWAYKTKKMQVSFRHLAETDTLTGVSNRHHFSRRAEAALEYCQRSGEQVALVMLDLDEFKAINDRHGHAMGDWVLQNVAAACRATCRKNDLFGRLGGEEFAFLLIGADLPSALQLAQECRERIGAIDTGSTGATFRVTASFGVAASADAGFNFHVLLARADEAMYRAKREGRDRISLHTPETIATGVVV